MTWYELIVELTFGMVCYALPWVVLHVMFIRVPLPPTVPLRKADPPIGVNDDIHKLRTCCCCCACCDCRMPIPKLAVFDRNRCCDHDCAATCHKVGTEKEKVTK